MKSHGLLVVMFLFSSGCALFGGSTTEEPAGCPAHPDQPQPNDARHYRASDAERDFNRHKEEMEAAKRAAQTPQPQEKPESKPATPAAPKIKRQKKKPAPPAPAAVAEIKKPAPDPERRALQLEAEICDRVVEAKRETQDVRAQLEKERRKSGEQAQPRPGPEALPPQPMRPQYTANGAVWSWRTILEGMGVFLACLLLWLRGEARLQRWGKEQAAKAERLEQEILALKAEIANLQVQLQQQAPKI